MELKLVRLTKLEEAPNALHPENIEVGFVKEGKFWAEPKVGSPFEMDNYWSTSTVQEILSPNTFRTFNSIYKWEMIEQIA